MRYFHKILPVLSIVLFLSEEISAQSTCDINLIRQTFTAAGYIELNVQGQPCSMYFVNPTSQDANISEQQAQQLGAHLVVFNDAAENTAVNNALNASPFAGQTIWVGYKRTSVGANTFYTLDGTSGNFVPNSGSGIYENWDSGEPNNNQFQSGCFPSFSCSSCSDQYRCTYGEECVQIRSSGLWNDLPCDRSSVSVIEVNLCPQITVNAPTICQGANTNLNATTVLGSNPYTYTWDNGAGTGASVPVSPASTTTYSVTVSDRYGCSGNTSTTVTVDPNCSPPACDIQAIRNAFQQAGGYVELSTPSQSCSMYFVNTRSQDADISEQQAQALGAHMVVMNDAAENAAVTAALNAAGYGGATIWIGYKRTGTGQQTFYALDGTTGPFIPNNAPTVYQNWAGGEPNNNAYNNCFGGCGSIFCSDQYRCQYGEQCVQIYPGGQWNDLPCNRNSISVVEVNLCPQITVNIAPTLCLGQSAQLNATTLLGSTPYSYTWSTGENTTSITVTPTEPTTYSVTVSDRYNCTSDRSIPIDVDSGYIATFFAPLSVCPNAPATITYAGNAPPNANYIWNFDGGTVLSGSGQGPYSVSWNTPGTKNISLDIPATGNCPTIPETNQVLVLNPPLPDAGQDVAICSGGSAQLGGTTNQGSIYSWSPVNGLSDPNIANPTVTLTNQTLAPVTTTYTLTEDINGCIGTATVNVTVNPATAVNTNPSGSIQICQGGQADIVADPGYVSYTWSNNASGQTLTVNSAGNYFVIAVDANGCQSVSLPVDVTVNPPLPLNVTAGGPLQICNGESVTLTADPGLNNYVWSNNATGQILSVTTTGNYNVSATDVNGCEYVSAFTNVQVFDKPVISIVSTTDVSCFGLQNGAATFNTTGGTPTYQYFLIPNTPLQGASANNLAPGSYNVYVSDGAQCGDTATFSIAEPSAPLQINLINLQNVSCFGYSDGQIIVDATGGTAAYSYNWSNSQGGATANGLSAGTFTVTATDNNGCIETASFDITEPPAVGVSLPDSYEIILGKSVVLTPSYDNNINYFFNWTPDYNLSNSNAPNPAASPYQTTNYTLTISDDNNCRASDTVTVIVKDSILIYIPNIFTPNGDGINDVFLVNANAVKDFYMVIFNRWGEKVFEANSINAGWNGTRNGKELEVGVYVYHVTLTFLNYTQEKRKGSITLAR
jgi:gliding motility-associated-like protein